jgi:hypothetical protein
MSDLNRPSYQQLQKELSELQAKLRQLYPDGPPSKVPLAKPDALYSCRATKTSYC